MIKLCIALALLATITLAGNCAYNELLATAGVAISSVCTCAATDDLSPSGSRVTNKYCQKKWNGSSFDKSIQTAPASGTCSSSSATDGDFTRFTTDCLIGQYTSSGTKICSNANVYVSDSSCPLINKCDQDTVIAGNTAPCLCADKTANAAIDLKLADKYCHGTTVTDKPSDCTNTSPSFLATDQLMNQKYVGTTCMLTGSKKVCTKNLVWKQSTIVCPDLPTNICTTNVKITGIKTCLPEEGSVKVCKVGEYANGFNDACNAMPSSWCSDLDYKQLAVYQKWTGRVCKVPDGTKVCSQDTTYKVTTSSCPVLPTTICTPNEKITSGVCLAIDDAVTVCKAGQYADGSTDACPVMPEVCGVSGGSSKQKNAVVTGIDCECVTDTVCPEDQYCWSGTTKICNAAKKSCATGAPNADTVYSCTGTGWTYVAANSATACPAAGCDDATCCSKPTCSTFDGCGKLDKTTTDCEDAGCDAKTCCEAFSSSKNSALTMGVQTAAFMVIMIFI